jgi:class 3 adenylate cyclase/predicted ATPase
MQKCAACGAAVPADARFCPACATPVEAPSSEERKLATVLFADLVGSTELGEQDPERTRALLDRFYEAMASEIEAAGGTVEKFVGDAVMAAFGAPAALEDHAERALHSALAMRRTLKELFGDSLTLRIGVNTGEVVVGRPREGSSFVTGDAVNVAARLEQAAEPGQIVAGERTVASARGAFEFGPPLTLEAKGKAGGVRGRPVARALSLMRPRGVGDLENVFVGRSEELELLEGAYRESIATRQPRLVTLLGDAGVGKTRLARELWEWLAQQSPEPVRRVGRCLAYGRAITYWPLAEVLKEHLGVLDSDSAESVLSRLEGREIIGMTLGLDVVGELHPLVARDRLHDAWVDFLTELAAERPVVLLIEDLHWAEEPLLDLLERIAAEATGPILLLATARPELRDARPGFGADRSFSTMLTLEPLSQDLAGRMLDGLLATRLPAELRRVVVERAEGNPFFVEELVRTLIDRAVIERVGSDWIVHELPAGFEVPDSIQAVLAARIDLLDSTEKSALQAAAVIGRIFWARPVYELLEGLEPSLRVLEQRDFIRRRSGSSLLGEQEYAIKHALTREVAYSSLPKAKRAQLHAAFADWLERLGEGRDEYASFLAHHYAEAARPEDADLAWAGAEDELERVRGLAVSWLRHAAQLSAGRYEVEETLALLERALALARGDGERIDVLRQVSKTHTLRYDANGFRAAAEQALALGPDRAVAAEIYAELAHYGYGRPYMWRRPPPDDLARDWLEQALRLAEPGTLARGNARLAEALARPEDEAASDAAAEVVAIAERVNETTLLAQAYEANALVATARRSFEEACRWAQRALDLAPHVADPGYRVHQYWYAGFVHLRGGRIAAVPAIAEECARLAEALTPHDEVHAVGLQSLVLSCLGDWERLRGFATRAEQAAEANRDFPCQFNWRSLVVCALGAANVGDDAGARRLEEEARERVVVAGPLEREPALLRLALARGDLDEVARILELLPATGDPWGLDSGAARLDALMRLGDRPGVEKEAAPFLEDTSYTRPFALRALGFVREDEHLLDRAAEAFEEIGLRWRVAETRALVAAAR